ncbi:serine/threonine protein kinase [Planktothricoides sp. SR001]|uniref:serine/threonine-protein kinase n=1 Tax=Planktothricoides sp. SR001 TaxID=1705388 RepID=UPI0006C10A62|nr:serine/threonine-protein kinase [Planktothricoides sp. SR001]KOR36165.1 serine/threonine protein kinase [Planktothricoides sp. SR001]
MSYCVNPKCPQPDDPANQNQNHCVHCGTELLIQGRYRISREIGSGGFGKTYEVDDRGIPRVLKVLLQNHEKAIKLFKQEADVMMRLDCPGIPKVQPDGYFEIPLPEGQDPLHALVMEKINGLNLREWMKKRRNKPITEELAIDWLKQLSEILSVVHQEQFFHRDIKPLNIMIKRNGQLVLIDFGAAREVTNTYFAKVGQGQNITGIVSPGYTAPEQANGKAVPQSDFYSLGRTFVFLITGKSPTSFSEHPRTGKLVWRRSAPQISDGFADVIDYLMASFPGKRPQNAQAIIRCLEELKHASPSSDADESEPSLVSQKNTGGFNRNTGKNPTKMSPTRNTPTSVSSLGSRASASKIKQVSRVQPYTPYQPPKKIPWGLMLTLLILSLLGSQVYGYWRYGFFPASPISLIVSLPSSVFLQKSLTGVGQIQSLAMGPESRIPMFASGSYGKIRIWNLQTGVQVKELDAHRSWVNALAISPNGQILASGSEDTTIRILNFQTGELLQSIPAHSGPVNALAISPNGQILASGSADRTIRFWNLSDGVRLRTISGHQDAVNAIAWSPNGRLIASGSSDRTIQIWDAITGTRVRKLQGHGNAVLSVTFSADSQLVASGSRDNTVIVWDLKTGQQKYQLTGDNSWVRSVAIAPDGQLLATSGNNLNIWNLNTGKLEKVLLGHEQYISVFALSPDNQTIVTGSPDKTIKIWRLPPLSESEKSK